MRDLKLRRLLSSMITGLFFPMVILCQSPYKVYYYTTEDGLPQNTITSIIKDSRGFLWFGTPNGLCRFDGYQIKVYKSVSVDKGVNQNTINSLCEDDAGNLWIGSSKGLLYFNFQQETFISVDIAGQEMTTKKINALRTQQNELWLATDNGLYQSTYAIVNEWPVIETQGLKIYRPAEVYNVIADTRDYGLLFGSANGLYRYDSVSRSIIKVDFFSQAGPDLIYPKS